MSSVYDQDRNTMYTALLATMLTPPSSPSSVLVQWALRPDRDQVEQLAILHAQQRRVGLGAG